MASLSIPGPAELYHDLQGLESVKRMDRDQSVAEVARQFEALLLQSMVASMRAAGDVLGEGGPFDSGEARFYRDMLDQQLTMDLSRRGGIGLAAVIQRQLDPTAALDEVRPAPAVVPVRAAAATPSAPPIEADPADEGRSGFVSRLQPLAERTAAELGVSAELLLSQAALETGWGRQVLRDGGGRSSNNLFNIKAGSDWQGPVVTVPTLEYRDGVAVREWAAFRAYDSPEASFSDYAELVRSNPRYRQALAAAGDDRRYIEELAAAGYATDPDYADKVMGVLERGLAAARSEP